MFQDVSAFSFLTASFRPLLPNAGVAGSSRLPFPLSLFLFFFLLLFLGNDQRLCYSLRTGRGKKALNIIDTNSCIWSCGKPAPSERCLVLKRWRKSEKKQCFPPPPPTRTLLREREREKKEKRKRSLSTQVPTVIECKFLKEDKHLPWQTPLERAGITHTTERL